MTTKITLSLITLRDEVLYDLATTHPEAAVRLPCRQELDRRHPEEAVARKARVLATAEAQRQRPGVFDLRRQLGRAPTAAEYRASR